MRRCLTVALCAGRYKHLKLGERMVASWFAMSGVVHFCIEGMLRLQPSDRSPGLHDTPPRQ